MAEMSAGIPGHSTAPPPPEPHGETTLFAGRAANEDLLALGDHYLRQYDKPSPFSTNQRMNEGR